MNSIAVMENKFLKYSSYLSFLSVIPACIALMGWIISSPQFYRIKQQFPAMNIGTIITVFLLAATIAVFNYNFRTTSTKFNVYQALARILPGITLLIIAASFFAYLPVLFYQVDTDHHFPNWITSPRSLIALTLILASAYFSSRTNISKTVNFIILVIPFYVAIISLTGYVLAENSYYSYFPDIGMSILTALSVVLLISAVITGPLRKVGNGFLLDSSQGGIAVRYGLAISLLFPPINTWFVWTGYNYDLYSREMAVVLLVVFPCSILSLVVVLFAYKLVQIESVSVTTKQEKKALENEYDLYKLKEQAREHFEAIIEGTADAIISQDLEGRITFHNHAAKRLLKGKSGVLNGHTVISHLDVNDFNTFHKAIKRAKTGEIVRDKELCIVHPITREPLNISMTLSPIKTHDGSIIEIAIIMRDISELTKQLKYSENLAKELKIANSAKDQFLANLSHELRTPLNITMGYSELLSELKQGSPEFNEAIAAIRKSSESELALVESILDVSRIVSGKIRFDFSYIQLHDVIANQVKLITTSFEKKGIDLTYDIEPLQTDYFGDENRIRQIIWNLLSNALKFTPSGGKVEIKAKLNVNDYEVSVSDTGTGIPKDMLAKVFDRFWQVDTSYTRNYQGLGVGLSIAQHLAQGHGGELRAFSKGVGEGAEFTLILPLTNTLKSEDITEKIREVKFKCKKNLERLNFLVVEDNYDSRIMLEQFLKTQNADVLTAASGKEALKIFDIHRFDFVICDIGLPEIDGFEIARNLIHKSKRLESRPVLISLSGFVAPEDYNKAKNSGFDYTLAKPIQLNELCKIIDSHLK